jgi:hypothetical protein
MRKLVGFLMAAFGLAFGYVAYKNAPSHREDQLAAVTRILTNPGVDSSSVARTAVAAPSAKLTPAEPSAQPAPAPATVAQTAQTPPAQVAEAVVPKSPPQPAATTAWQTSVKADAQRPGATAAVTSATPGDRSARYELVKSLQTELKRVGCYGGEANGSWGSGSKRALAAFMERVNATLPIDRPDYIQLTLVQNQKGIVCGRDCPKGQAQAGDGRCVPDAILAHAESKTSTEPASSNAGNSNTTVVATAEELPWARKSTEPSAQTTVTAAIAEPSAPRPSMAGRMSVGGPLPQDNSTASPAKPDVASTNGSVARVPEQVARLETAEPVQIEQDAVKADDNAARQDNAPASANARPARNQQKVAALVVAPVKVAPPRFAAQPRARVVVPRYYARVQRASVRQQRPRAYANYRARTVQNLFTHPLGRM